MTPPVSAGTVRLTCVLNDGQPSCFLAFVRRRTAGEVAVLADLYARGHADLAFDLLCDWLRSRQGR